MGLAEKIRELSPQLALEGVRAAIEGGPGAIGELNLEAELAELGAAFDAAREAPRIFPRRLIEPLEERVREALRWSRRCGWSSGNQPSTSSPRGPSSCSASSTRHASKVRSPGCSNRAKVLIDRSAGGSSPTGWLYSLLAGLAHRRPGAGSRPGQHRCRFPLRRQRLGGRALNQRATSIAGALARTRATLQALNLTALSVEIAAQVQPIRDLIGALNRTPGRRTAQRLAGAARGRGRFRRAGGRPRALPRGAGGRGRARRDAARTGFSDAEVVVVRLRIAFAPLRVIPDLLRELLAHLGITGFEGGLRGVLQATLAAVPPARLAALPVPVFRALRGRVEVLLEAVLEPCAKASPRCAR